MITLRDLVQRHPHIAGITGEECRLIAAVLEAAAGSRLVRFFLPKEHRQKVLALRMLAAALARTPEDAPKSFAGQVRTLMLKDKGQAPRDEWSASELEGRHG